MQRLLGRGGMAEVFKVRLPGESRSYALKRLLADQRLNAESVRLFRAEVELSRHLQHPNIVEVYGGGRDGDSAFMVMEFIDGRDVAQIVRRCRKRDVLWPIDFAVFLTRALLDALAYAHAAHGPDGQPLGVVHCDVSPSNFFVSRTGELRLGDFGVARSRIEGGADDVMGKPYYLSPEALEGEIAPSVDLWAVAVTLYELLTLQRPFTGKDGAEVYEAIRRSRYVPIRELRPEVPAVVEGLLARAFDCEPELRFTTAAEFAHALEPLYDARVGTPLAISAVVRGLFGHSDDDLAPVPG